MNATKKLVTLSQTAVRHFHKTNAVRATETSRALKREKLKELQNRFQIEDGTPVYIKGGLGDKVLLGVTCILTLVGLGMSAETVYTILNK